MKIRISIYCLISIGVACFSQFSLANSNNWVELRAIESDWNFSAASGSASENRDVRGGISLGHAFTSNIDIFIGFDDVGSADVTRLFQDNFGAINNIFPGEISSVRVRGKLMRLSSAVRLPISKYLGLEDKSIDLGFKFTGGVNLSRFIFDIEGLGVFFDPDDLPQSGPLPNLTLQASRKTITDADIYYGVGVYAIFHEQVGLSLDYTFNDLSFEFQNREIELDLDTLSLGISYHF